MSTPLHVTSLTLPPDYFSPGVSIMHGKPCFSKWAIAYWHGREFRFERTDLGQPWVRTNSP